MDVYIPEMQLFVPPWALFTLAYLVGFAVTLTIVRRLMLIKTPANQWDIDDYIPLTFMSLAWPISLPLGCVGAFFFAIVLIVRFFFEPRK